MKTTGPAHDLEQAHQIVALMNELKWKTYADYLSNIKAAAEKSLRKIHNTPEQNGYWKGAIQILEDILENIPDGLQRQIDGLREPDRPDSQVWV